MRIGILAIQHESNTFVAGRTTLDEFRADALLGSDTMVAYCRASQHETRGFLVELEKAGVDIVPLLLALATPGGPLEDETAGRLVAWALERIENAGRLDGLLVAPHGAAVAESWPDFDGHWLMEVRRAVGPDVPIVGTLDPHANLSPAMVAATDALIAYRTNPHTDQHQTGRRAARLLLRTLRGEVRPVQAAAFPPVAISIDRQATRESPCRELYIGAAAQVAELGLLSNSIILGFPYADVAEVGSSVIAVSDGSAELAQRAADMLAAALVTRRREFACGLPVVEDALREAAASRERVCLLDVGDNVGGGAAGDGTLLARRLHELGLGPAVACLWDPEAVAQATAIAAGNRAELTMGGRLTKEQGPPLTARVELLWSGEKRIYETKPVHGGRAMYDMGNTAVVRTEGGLTLILMSRRVPPFSLRQLTAGGLDPASFRVLVAKGVNAPLAAYSEVCERFIRVDTPGPTCANMTRLPFARRRRPLFPFEDLET